MMLEVEIDDEPVGCSETGVLETGDTLKETDRGIEFVDGLNMYSLQQVKFQDGVADAMLTKAVTGQDVRCAIKIFGTGPRIGTGRILHVDAKDGRLRALVFASREFILRATAGKEPDSCTK